MEKHSKYIHDRDHLDDKLAGVEWQRENPARQPMKEGVRALFAAILGQAIVGAIEGNEDDLSWLLNQKKYMLGARAVCEGLSLDLDKIVPKLLAGGYDIAEVRLLVSYRQVGNVSRSMSEAETKQGRKSSPYCAKWDGGP